MEEQRAKDGYTGLARAEEVAWSWIDDMDAPPVILERKLMVPSS